MAVVLLVLVTDLRGAIGFSSFGVLAYYAITNAAAFTQSGPERRAPRALNVVGCVACVSLMVTLPAEAVGLGIAVLAVGLTGRLLTLRLGRSPAPTG